VRKKDGIPAILLVVIIFLAFSSTLQHYGTINLCKFAELDLRAQLDHLISNSSLLCMLQGCHFALYF
jgi:hypothetical protein